MPREQNFDMLSSYSSFERLTEFLELNIQQTSLQLFRSEPHTHLDICLRTTELCLQELRFNSQKPRVPAMVQIN